MTSTSISSPLRMNLGFKKEASEAIGPSSDAATPDASIDAVPPGSLYGPFGTASWQTDGGPSVVPDVARNRYIRNGRVGSWDRIRTCDLAIMSRLLYH